MQYGKKKKKLPFEVGETRWNEVSSLHSQNANWRSSVVSLRFWLAFPGILWAVLWSFLGLPDLILTSTVPGNCHFLITFWTEMGTWKHTAIFFSHFAGCPNLCTPPRMLWELKTKHASQAAGKQCFFDMLAFWILHHYCDSCNHANIWQHFCTCHASQIILDMDSRLPLSWGWIWTWRFISPYVWTS